MTGSADLWYPGGVHDPAPPDVWGSFTDSGEPKFLLHTTEGSLGVYSPDPNTGAGRRYYGNTGTWPNYTLAWHAQSNAWRVYNHIPANRSSLSLRNLPGGVQTNRDNVTQVEIATRAVDVRALPDRAMDELAKLLAWEHQVRKVPLVSAVAWRPYPASYGGHAPQRLSWSAWDAYSGVLGHMHVPENQHGDPGDLDVGTLLSCARAYVHQPPSSPNAHLENDVTEQDKIDIANRVIEALRVQVFSVEPTIRQAGPGQAIGATYNKVGDLQRVVGGEGGLSERVGLVGIGLTTVRNEIAVLDSKLDALFTAVGAVPALSDLPASPTSVEAKVDALLDHLGVEYPPPPAQPPAVPAPHPGQE